MKNLALMTGFNTIKHLIVAYFFGPPCIYCAWAV